MSKEYDALYTLLEGLMKNPTEQVKLSTIIPKEIIKDAKRGRPPGSKTKHPKNIRCAACNKRYPNTKLRDAHEASNLSCKKFFALEAKPPIVERSIFKIISDTMDAALHESGNVCRFCEVKFVNTRSFRVHYAHAKECNRMAYAEFKKLLE